VGFCCWYRSLTLKQETLVDCNDYTPPNGVNFATKIVPTMVSPQPSTALGSFIPGKSGKHDLHFGYFIERTVVEIVFFEKMVLEDLPAFG